MKQIVLAGGCFWGIEEFLSRITGVIETEVGYANGRTQNPTYEDVCYKNTGFAEACLVKYNEEILTLKSILKSFWSIINPTTLNRQGPDIGSQYRTGIYYISEEDLPVIVESRDREQKSYDRKIVTEIKPLENYYKAEDYHQKYLKKNPNGYCHIPLD